VAYSYLKANQEVFFENEGVDFDGTTNEISHGGKVSKKPAGKVSKKPATKMLKGRMLVAKGRTSKKVRMQPVFDKKVDRKSASPPETRLEVDAFVKSCLKAGNNIGNADGGHAFQGAIKDTKSPSTVVRHNREEYTPTVRIYKKGLDKRQLRTLKSMVKRDLAIEMKYFFKVVGGRPRHKTTLWLGTGSWCGGSWRELDRETWGRASHVAFKSTELL
jgi:hypothetical protein